MRARQPLDAPGSPPAATSGFKWLDRLALSVAVYVAIDAHARPRAASRLDEALLERISHRADLYRDRRALGAPVEKRVDNFGVGDARLDETRSVRLVLHVVL